MVGPRRGSIVHVRAVIFSLVRSLEASIEAEHQDGHGPQPADAP